MKILTRSQHAGGAYGESLPKAVATLWNFSSSEKALGGF